MLYKFQKAIQNECNSKSFQAMAKWLYLPNSYQIYGQTCLVLKPWWPKQHLQNRMTLAKCLLQKQNEIVCTTHTVGNIIESRYNRYIRMRAHVALPLKTYRRIFADAILDAFASYTSLNCNISSSKLVLS